MLIVLTLITGLAVAFKFFDHPVPHNVVRDSGIFNYEVWKQDTAIDPPETTYSNTAGGAPIFASGVEMNPGDTRKVDVKLVNTHLPERDASFYLHIPFDSIVVRDGDDNIVPPDTDGPWNRFVNLWELSIERQRILQPTDGLEVTYDDHTGQNLANPNGNPDDSGRREWDHVCLGSLSALPATEECRLGLVRGSGSRDSLGQATDVRYYQFYLEQVDDGSPTPPFPGWTVTFSIVFRAQIPAAPETGLTR